MRVRANPSIVIILVSGDSFFHIISSIVRGHHVGGCKNASCSIIIVGGCTSEDFLCPIVVNDGMYEYFACESITEKASDGAVYAFPNVPVSWSTDPLVELIMDFVFDYYPEKVWLDQMLEHAKIKYASSIHRLMPDNIDSLLHYLTIPAFAVMPTKTNERIEAQDGAFYIFGMKLRSREVSTNPGTLGRVYYNFDPVDIEKPEIIWPKAETILVPASAKDGILKQLDLLGINERKLFPDLTHQISYTVNAVKNHMFK